jgi:hypothetical protein
MQLSWLLLCAHRCKYLSRPYDFVTTTKKQQNNNNNNNNNNMIIIRGLRANKQITFENLSL